MQVVIHIGGTAESYIQERRWEGVSAPACCPNCKNQKRLRSLGYYERSIASIRSVKCMRLLVRRFRCFGCGHTTSLLPSFCQPYRLLPNEMIASYFREPTKNYFKSWEFLLKRYWCCYTDWLNEIQSRLFKDFGLNAIKQGPGETWLAVEAAFNGLAEATVNLVMKSRITFFGIYQCHQPFWDSLVPEKVHTTVLFRSGKDPPHFGPTDENERSPSS